MSALGKVLRCGRTRLKLCRLPLAPKQQIESRPFPSGTETQGGSSRCQVLVSRLPLGLQVLHGCPLKYRHLACEFSPANLTMQRGHPLLCRLDSFASCWACTENKSLLRRSFHICQVCNYPLTIFGCAYGSVCIVFLEDVRGGVLQSAGQGG